MDAAARVFADRGIAATSLNEVAAEAGLTKGAVYSSFSGKDDLVLAILEEHLIERMHRATEAYHQMAEFGDATVEAGARLLEGVQTDATWHRLYLEYWGLAMRDPVVHAGLAERRRKLRDAIAGAIREAARQHRVSLPLAPEALAVTLLALSNGLAVERGVDPNSVQDNLFVNLLRLLVGVDAGPRVPEQNR